MKKNTLIITAITVSAALASCSSDSTNAESTQSGAPQETNAEVANWTVDADQSSIRWTGGTAGAAVYSHFGDIKVKSGALTTEGKGIKTGAFVVDMTTVTPKDKGYNEENTAAKLVGHLSSADFFNVEAYPESSFNITSVQGNKIMGNLTIRGNTNLETISVSNMTMNEDGSMTATGTLVFDRQKYDVAWEHFLKDTVLSDDITLEITLVAKQA
ncbi:MAG: YceI family protein [Cryomorphaceae bacterium]